MSAYSMKTWLKKGYTEEEAKYQIAIRRPTNRLYWINKGYSEEEADEMLKNHQAKGGKAFSNLPAEEKRKTRTTCIEYYLEQGHSHEEAEKLRSERQATFSKEKCIEKHGEEHGLRIWQERQSKWQSSLNAKPQEEKDAINASKKWNKNLSEDEIDIINERRSLTLKDIWDSKTEEEKLNWSRLCKELWESKTEEEKEQFSEALRAAWDSKTEEEKLNWSRLRKELWDSKTEEEKKQFSSALKSGWDSKTEEERQEHRRIIREAKLRDGKALPDELKDEFAEYRREVRRYTNYQKIENLTNYNLRGKTGYHLDHKFSVFEGFKAGIHPAIIGNIVNLQMLPYLENLSKNIQCSITIDELLEELSKNDD